MYMDKNNNSYFSLSYAFEMVFREKVITKIPKNKKIKNRKYARIFWHKNKNLSSIVMLTWE